MPIVKGGQRLRFYAGVPLCMNGCGLGTLFVMDDKPRTVTKEKIVILRMLKDACFAMISRNALIDEVCYNRAKRDEQEKEIEALKKEIARLQGDQAPRSSALKISTEVKGKELKGLKITKSADEKVVEHSDKGVEGLRKLKECCPFANFKARGESRVGLARTSDAELR